MKKNQIYHYYVEGEDERVIIDTLKSQLRVIVPGKVDIHNVVEKKLKKNMLMRLQPNTIVVFVFDTDTDNTDILMENISIAERMSNVKKVVCVTQVKKLEDEIVRSCDICKAEDLTQSSGKNNFKHDLIKEKSLHTKLKKVNFDINLFWSQKATGKFSNIKNQADVIKILMHEAT